MKKVIILQGLPASGKSTWAKKMVTDNPGKYKRVNKDDLRSMLDCGRFSRSNEKTVLSVRDAIILESLEAGSHVIVDDTNLHKKHVNHITELVKGKAKVETKFFDVSVEEAIRRDLERPASVGESVIINMYNQFLKSDTEKYVPNQLKPTAYIFDIDGTLAEMNGRSPYEWDKVGEDILKHPVWHVLIGLKSLGDKIIVFTGRDGVCSEDTKKWLKRNLVPFDHFDIRPEGDTRKDSIIKKEMFDKVKDDYNILGVFDDRDQVVDMWRDIGLQCFQVNYGNF